MAIWFQAVGPGFNIKMTSYQYRKSHCGDKTILRPSYLHNGISYTGKTTSFYWIGAQAIIWTNVVQDHWYLIKTLGYNECIDDLMHRRSHPYLEGILPKGPYQPCVSMAGRALLAGYHRSYILNLHLSCTAPWVDCHLLQLTLNMAGISVVTSRWKNKDVKQDPFG